MRYILSVLAVVSFLFAPAAAAQTGTLTGKVIEPATRAPVPGATVSVVGGEAEAITDASGSYQLQLEAGTYTLKIEAGKDYEQKTVQSVQIKAGKTVERTLKLARSKGQGKDVAKYGEYTVRAGFLEGSTGSVLSKQQEAEAVTEVIGSEQMSRSGDSNAAETVSRLTGLTIQKGKFAIIRGQPKRYTSTTLNGSPMPSFDPIRNLTPLDLFPAQALSNITVQKSYSVNRIGAFGAGQIQLNTIGAPQEDFVEVSTSVGANSESTGEDGRQFDTADESLVTNGDPAGLLTLPASVGSQLEQGVPIALLPPSEKNQLGRSFSDELSPSSKTLGPDYGVSLAAGKRRELDSGTAGFRIATGWSRKARSEEEQRTTVKNAGSVANPRIERESQFTEERTEISRQFSALAAFSWEGDKNSFGSNTFLVRDATEKTEVDEGVFETSNGTAFERRVLLEYEQRELFAQQFNGSHDLNGATVDWRYQISRSERRLPDRRKYGFQNTRVDGSGEFRLDDNNPPNLERRFNTVEEDTESFGVDLTVPVVEQEGFSAQVKTGVSEQDRRRRSETSRFAFNVVGGDLSRPIEEIFADENIGNTVQFSSFGNANDYRGRAKVRGIYVQGDLTWTDALRVVGGIRAEEANYEVTTFQSGGAAGATAVQSGFDQNEILPSLTASYFLSKNMQIRAGLSRTVSYPVLVEVSDTAFINPDTNENFRGNKDLGPATIDSADLRWEWYPSPSEKLTAALFYKEYTDPIERTFTNVGGGGQTITLRNAQEGTVSGVEFSGRVELSRVSDALGNFYVLSNLALIDSEVKFDPEGTVATNTERQMQGQADSLFNLQIGYQGGKNTVTLTASRVGERLETAGVNGEPDEFREPVSKLGAKWAYAVTPAASLSLTLDNMTNEEIEKTRGDITTQSVKEGATASLGFDYRF